MWEERHGATGETDSQPRQSLSQREAASNILVMHQIADRERTIRALTAELDSIRGSAAWRIANVPRRFGAIIFPHQSRRRRAVRILMDRLRPLLSKGSENQPRPYTTDIGASKTIRDLAAGWDDEKYFKLLLDSVAQPYIGGARMPGFPAPVIQRQFVGSTAQSALREGYDFYKYVKGYCGALGVPLGTNTTVLDFGCGWGRISRFFFKDTANFYGVDVDPEMISFCKASMTCGSYAEVSPEPPTTFKDGSLDVVFAYSVFSHLAEPVALKWIEEFSRILKPNGILLATTQGRSFLDLCNSFREKRERKEELEFGWFEALAESFIPIEQAIEDYEAGKFLYSSTGGGGVRDKAFYGEALIPRKYIAQTYSRFLTLRDFVDDPRRLPQALFVMQKAS